MKIEVSEFGVKLIPESQFEVDALNKLTFNLGSIKKVKFQDDWNRTGPVEFTFYQPYERRQ